LAVSRKFLSCLSCEYRSAPKVYIKPFKTGIFIALHACLGVRKENGVEQFKGLEQVAFLHGVAPQVLRQLRQFAEECHFSAA
jgi:hypothetical protein